MSSVICNICGHETPVPEGCTADVCRVQDIALMPLDGKPWGVDRHPAPMPPSLAAAVVSRYTELGQSVGDPMVGRGTVPLVARRLGRQVAFAFDLEQAEVDKAKRRLGIDVAQVLDARDLQKLDPGDRAADLILTSPPYLGKRTKGARRGDVGNADDRIGGAFPRGKGINATRAGLSGDEYGRSPGNVAAMCMNPVLYADAMDRIYDGMYRWTKPGGHVAVVVADSHMAGKHMACAGVTATLLQEVGFKLVAWWQAVKVTGTSEPSLGRWDRHNVPRIMVAAGRAPSVEAVLADVFSYKDALVSQATEHVLIARRPE